MSQWWALTLTISERRKLFRMLRTGMHAVGEGTYRLKEQLLPDVRDNDIVMADSSTGH